MDSKTFYKTIEQNPVKEFLQLFGGEFYDGMNFGYLYQYGKTSYYLNEDFVQLAQKSIVENENLFLKLEKVVW